MLYYVLYVKLWTWGHHYRRNLLFNIKPCGYWKVLNLTEKSAWHFEWAKLIQCICILTLRLASIKRSHSNSNIPCMTASLKTSGIFFVRSWKENNKDISTVTWKKIINSISEKIRNTNRTWNQRLSVVSLNTAYKKIT